MEWILLIMLVVVGFILLLLEFLVFPWFNLVGIAVFLCVGAAIYVAYARVGSTAGHLTLVAIAAAGFLATWYVLRSSTWKRLQLDASVDSSVEGVDPSVREGDTGTCLGRLAPMGKVRVGEAVIEARSLDGYVDANSEIIVVKVYKNKVIVKLKTK